MKKKAWIIACIAIVLVVGIVLVLSLMPNRPDGTTDTPELVEITDFTQEQVDERLIGLMKEDVYHSWGEPDGKVPDYNSDYWYLNENNTSKITVHYNDDGLIEDIDIESAK